VTEMMVSAGTIKGFGGGGGGAGVAAGADCCAVVALEPAAGVDPAGAAELDASGVAEVAG